MTQLLFVLPTVEPGDSVRVDTATGSNTPATVYAARGGAVIGPTFHADPSGALPHVYGADGVTTLYLKHLNYKGTVTGSPVTVTGVDDSVAPPGPNAASGGLRTTVDTSVGDSGTFGLRYPTQMLASGVAPAIPDSAYTLDSAATVSDAVDNAYMAWDPAGGSPYVIIIKQGGFYLVNIILGFTNPLPADWTCRLDVTAGGVLPVVFDGDLPAGSADSNNTGTSFVVPQFIPAGTHMLLDFDGRGQTAQELNYALLTFLPMFDLAA